MDRLAALTWSWLNILTKKRYDALRESFGDLQAAYKVLDASLLRSLGCREETVPKVLGRLQQFDAARYEEALVRSGVTLLSLEDDAYPTMLREIGDPPVFLTVRGDVSIVRDPCIALVGTREMSAYGRRVAELFTQGFVQAGMVTVSGLAAGIDSIIAEETMRSGGRTVAVLGNGLASIYPRDNIRLADEIVRSGGLLLSEFPLDTAPDKYTFPARNRIIAGLSLGTVVLEAGEGSGALITAELALDYGREVFAVPGQIFDPGFAGCHALLSKGHAKLVRSPADVFVELGMMVPPEGSRTLFAPENPQEATVFAVLSSMPQSVDDLIERTGLAIGLIGSVLTVLELQGVARNVGEGKWVRV